MSWKGVTVINQRIRFISEYLNNYFFFSELLCNQFEISRKTGYKWIGRYKQFGPEGLKDQTRKPHDCPHKTELKVINAIKAIRLKYSHWGPKKLLVRLEKRYPNWIFPAISTTADILKREGLISHGKRRFRRKHPGCPKTKAEQPNDIWTADYKGHFKMRNGEYCYPLTVCDIFSRYLLGCQAHKAISLIDSKAYFTALFNKYGLPQRIRMEFPLLLVR